MNGEPTAIASNGPPPAVPAPAAGRPVLGRRNLPRASQACQMCRAKKARCDQQDPCSNCVRHDFTCEYAPKATQRSGARKESETSRDIGASGHPESSASVDGDDGQAVEVEKDDDGPVVVDEDANLGAQPDTVGDVNKHTTGTEYYGSSSGFSLLNQLFSHARSHASARIGRESSSGDSPLAVSGMNVGSIDSSDREPLWNDNLSARGEAPLLKHLSSNPLSIVNLLYNEESVVLPPSRSKTPVLTSEKGNSAAHLPSPGSSIARPSDDATGRTGDGAASGAGHNHSNGHDRTSHMLPNPRKHVLSTSEEEIRLAETLLEKEYVRLFFHNLHHLHPLLVLGSFTARCEKEIWNKGPLVKPRKDLMQFLALYNIVVAVGALVAGTDTLKSFEHELGLAAKKRKYQGSEMYSSMALSRAYFRKSRSLLGDVFEVCSLESAQTLFLMSLYCQNSLKPHACYMYSGMAVRTALAIGLPSESMSRSVPARKAARRTWWVIYSQEVDMCCSSGRRDSLGKPYHYQIPFPQIRGQSNAPAAELEDESLSMINVMVDFAVILRRASKEIYHDSKGLTLAEKSKVALELDKVLDDWRANLPPWLNLDSVSFRESEWASKQKLVLQLRYLNARILFHRPFLAHYATSTLTNSNSNPQTPLDDFTPNVDLCLTAARKTIDLFFESYAHRHYFRTWWYNSTYTLYAGMIVLYLLLLNYTKVSPDVLIRDVEKSLEILRSMEEASVARRSADLIQELLEVARAYLAERATLAHNLMANNGHAVGNGNNPSTSIPSDPSLFPAPSATTPTSTNPSNHNLTSTLPPSSTAAATTLDPAATSFWDFDSDLTRTLFSNNALSGQSRGDILATLVNPTILEEFAGGNGGNDYFSIGGAGGSGGFGIGGYGMGAGGPDPLDAFLNSGAGMDESLGMGWGDVGSVSGGGGAGGGGNAAGTPGQNQGQTAVGGATGRAGSVMGQQSPGSQSQGHRYSM